MFNENSDEISNAMGCKKMSLEDTKSFLCCFLFAKWLLMYELLHRLLVFVVCYLTAPLCYTFIYNLMLTASNNQQTQNNRGTKFLYLFSVCLNLRRTEAVVR